MTVLVSDIRQDAQDPLGLTRAQFDADPYQTTPQATHVQHAQGGRPDAGRRQLASSLRFAGAGRDPAHRLPRHAQRHAVPGDSGGDASAAEPRRRRDRLRSRLRRHRRARADALRRDRPGGRRRPGTPGRRPPRLSKTSSARHPTRRSACRAICVATRPTVRPRATSTRRSRRRCRAPGSWWAACARAQVTMDVSRPLHRAAQRRRFRLAEVQLHQPDGRSALAGCAAVDAARQRGARLRVTHAR